MPYSYQFTDDGHGVVSTGHGVITGGEIAQCHLARNMELAAMPAQEWGLTDFSRVTAFQVTMEQVQHIADIDAKAVQGLKHPVSVAIVAPQDLSYGLSRAWEALVARLDVSTHVFRTRAEAEAWLKEKHPEIKLG